MNRLLEYLDRQTTTLTVYNFTGDDEEWQALSEWLGSHGVALRADTAEYDTPVDAGLFHDGESLQEAVSVSTLVDRIGDHGGDTELPDVLSSKSRRTTVKPSRSIAEMLRLSREFERRAWRQGDGALHAGFQHLSAVAHSDRTRSVYERLVDAGVDVTVYGYPDTELADVPFTVVEDTERELDAYWFLLYDGGGQATRKAALVSEECREPAGSLAEQDDGGPVRVRATAENRTYDSYWTTDPERVDRLFELAREGHPSILRDVWTPGTEP